MFMKTKVQEIDEKFKTYLAKLVGKFLGVLRLPDAFAAAALAGLDHDGEAYPLCCSQPFFDRLHAGLLVQLVRNLQLLPLLRPRFVHRVHPIDFQPFRKKTCRYF
jgi:hypothetical protein